MNKGLYRKLAFQNIRKNKSTFMPFIITCITMTAMFYIQHSIYMQTNDNLFYGAQTMRIVLRFGAVVSAIFSVFVLFYTNGFLMKRRSKEFGLYSILGMGKKHIMRVVCWEIAIVGSGSIVLGLFSGVLFSRLMFMVLRKLLCLQTDFVFGINVKSVFISILLFGGLFLILVLVNSIRVYRLKPTELMNNGRVGEREPKAKWLLAIIGVLSLAVGYYLAVTTQNPIEAMSTFFIAVLCVIAGTYLLFMSGSIALLKLLKKNKGYYYQKGHFITVSGMMYRMKQNAVGLANICLLSTAVLVVLSTTFSLYVGMEDVLRRRYPRDVMTDYLYEKEMDDAEYLEKYHYNYSILEPAILEYAKKNNVTIKTPEQFYSYSAVGIFEKEQFIPVFRDQRTMITLNVMPLSDYNRQMKAKESLLKGEVLLYTSQVDIRSDKMIRIADKEFRVKKKIKAYPKMQFFSSSYDVMICLVVPDFDTMQELQQNIDKKTNLEKTSIYYHMNFDLEGQLEDKEAFCEGLREVIGNTGIAHIRVVEDIFRNRQGFFGIYGSLFFIGIFIGALFLITTVMIIYYKQISEGYEDRERFKIMQKVGMSGEETKSVIRNQILLVFFLPILLAVIHICFAFDIIKKILVMLNFSNVPLFIVCTVATVFIFFVVYGIVYALTAKTYYRITHQD